MGSFEDTAPTLTSERPEAYCGTCDRSYPIEMATCPSDGTKLVRFKSQADPMLGRVLDGRYRIETKLGQGGMGTVYRGRQLSIEREVAIKVVHATIASDRDTAKRFLREARLASKLSAPGIVAAYDFGQTDDGVLFLVMELIEGRSLADALRNKQPLDPGRVALIAMQLCDALVVAHGAGIIHRDLKPANIITVDTPTGEMVKVLDFGIAKAIDTPSITSTQGMIGTPIYMAPEQFEGRSDVRSDMYSLGCVLYELCSGAPPFTATDINALLTKHLVEPPPPLPVGVPQKLARGIERLLEKDPANRFQSAAELRNALKGAVPYQAGPIIRTSMMQLPDPLATTGETGIATPRGTVASAIDTAPTRALGRRSLAMLLAGAVAAAALGIGVFYVLRPPTHAPAAAATPDDPAAPAAAHAPIENAPPRPEAVTTSTVDAGVALAADAAAIDATASVKLPRSTSKKPAASTKKKPVVKRPTGSAPPAGEGDVELPFVKPK